MSERLVKLFAEFLDFCVKRHPDLQVEAIGLRTNQSAKPLFFPVPYGLRVPLPGSIVTMADFRCHRCPSRTPRARREGLFQVDVKFLLAAFHRISKA
jgi:hypothetical protein